MASLCSFHVCTTSICVIATYLHLSVLIMKKCLLSSFLLILEVWDLKRPHMGNHVACIFGGIGFDLYSFLQGQMGLLILFSPQPVKPLRAVGVLFSPMESGWVGGRAVRRGEKFVRAISQKL